MSKKTWSRNTDGMTSYAQRRAQEAREKVDRAITSLVRSGQPVNINSVATAAGVTKTYLYSKPDLRDRIDTLRQQSGGVRARQLRKQERTDASASILLAAKDKRIKELEAEVKQLRVELKTTLGKLYDRI